MFMHTYTNEFINTSKIDFFEVIKMKNSENYGVLAHSGEYAHVVVLRNNYKGALEMMKYIISAINSNNFQYLETLR